MKNFRKTIIALATVAAMLVPSAAMAATLTTTVDKDITGDVYVGFYDGAILKDVVKTTVDAITVDDATPAGTEETLPATVTVTNEERASNRTDAQIYKLVFKATVDDTCTAINMMLSYDKTVIQPVGTNKDAVDTEGFGAEIKPYKTFLTQVWDDNLEMNVPTGLSFVPPIPITTIGDREAALFTIRPIDGYTLNLSNGKMFFEFYYRVKDGKTVTADTFKIETEIGAGTFNEAIGSKGAENGIKLASKSGGYTYGSWNNGTAINNTIAFSGFPFAEAEEEPTTKDLTVEVPTGAEGYKATMFIWDADQIAQCDPIALN